MTFARARHQAPAASGLLVLAVSTVAILGSAAPAWTEEAANPLTSMFGLFGAPPPDKDQEAIDYRPRAPLVVPPSRDLPAPKQAVRDPAWPKEPDAAARRKAALDSRRPAPGAASSPVAEPEPQGSQAKAAEPAKSDENEGECLLNGTGPQSCFQAPWKLLVSTFGGGGSADAAKPGVEPARKVLTEPPAGYRTATVVPKSESKPDEEESGIGGFLRVLGIGKSADN